MGYAYSRINFQVATAVAQSCAALFTFVIPHLHRLDFLLADFFAIGLFLGFWEAGSNVFILHLWGKETAPFMQSLHFMFGVGAMLIPLIAQPFLIEDGFLESVGQNISVPTNVTAEVFHPEKVMLVYPYTFVACYLAMTAVLTTAVWHRYPETSEHPSRTVQDGEKEEEGGPTTKKAWCKMLLICLTAAFMHIYYGLQISFGSFLMTFAVQSDLGLRKQDGALLSTLFWLTFTLFRLVTVTVLDRLRGHSSIFFCLSIILVSNCFLVPFGNSNFVLLAVGVGMIGIGMSSVWASIFEFLESNFKVTSGISSIVVISAILGEFVFPVIISSFISAYPLVLLWVVLFCSTTITLIFCLMFVTSKLLRK